MRRRCGLYVKLKPIDMIKIVLIFESRAESKNYIEKRRIICISVVLQQQYK